MKEQIHIKLRKEEKELIKKASHLVGLGHSTFSRVSALKEARLVLKENKGDLKNE